MLAEKKAKAKAAAEEVKDSAQTLKALTGHMRLIQDRKVIGSLLERAKSTDAKAIADFEGREQLLAKYDLSAAMQPEEMLDGYESGHPQRTSDFARLQQQQEAGGDAPGRRFLSKVDGGYEQEPVPALK